MLRASRWRPAGLRLRAGFAWLSYSCVRAGSRGLIYSCVRARAACARINGGANSKMASRTKTQLAAVDTLASTAPHLVLHATAAIPSKTRLNAALEDSQIAHLSLLGDPRSTDSA